MTDQPTERIDLSAGAPGAGSDLPPGATMPGPPVDLPAGAAPDAGSHHHVDGVQIARNWFTQPDNILMAITAVVAVVFLILVGTLGGH